MTGPLLEAYPKTASDARWSADITAASARIETWTWRLSIFSALGTCAFFVLAYGHMIQTDTGLSALRINTPAALPWAALPWVVLTVLLLALLAAAEASEIYRSYAIAARGLSLPQAELALTLAGLAEALSGPSLRAARLVNDPGLAARLGVSYDGCANHLARLLSAYEGLDGATDSELGQAVVRRLSDEARNLGYQIELLREIAPDCLNFNRLRGGSTRAEARAIIMSRLGVSDGQSRSAR
jgi:hypothetical protein